MQLTKLSFQAFGPYVEKQTLDFSALSNHPLCLIRGETGAGKTVILDAITYAIYGKSSGGERGEWESMRSRLASDELKTFVDLCFIINQKTYRFYREITIHTKKNGEKKQQVRIDCGEYIDGIYRPFFENCKLKIMEEKAVSLISLTHAQFIQVILLPQGKFEQLLVSKSEAKQEILKTLFQISDWEGICDKLTEKQRIAKSELDALANQSEWLLKQAEVDSLDALKDIQSELAKTCAFHKTNRDRTKKEVENTLKKIQEQELLQNTRLQLQESEALHTQLMERENEILTIQKKLVKWDAYAKIKPHYDAWKESETHLNKRKIELKEMEENYTVLLKDKANKEIIWDALPIQKTHLEAIKQKLQSFEFMKEKQQEITKVQRLLDTKQQQLDTETQLLQMHKEKVKRRQKGYQETEDELLFIQEIQTEYPTHLLEFQTKTRALELSGFLSDLLDKQKGLKENSETIANKIQELLQNQLDKQRVHETLYRAFLNHSASVLQASLQEGKPCPVCGSLHHESSLKQAQYIDVAQVNDSQKALDSLQLEIHETKSQALKLDEEMQELEQEIEKTDTELRKLIAHGFDYDRYRKLQCYIPFCEEMMKPQASLLKKHQKQKTKLDKLQEELEVLQKSFNQIEQEVCVLTTKVSEKQAQIDTTFDEATYLDMQKEFEQLNTHIQTQEALKQQILMRLQTLQANVESAKNEYKLASIRCVKAKENYLAQSNHESVEILDVSIEEVQIWREIETNYQKQKQETEIAIQTLKQQLLTQVIEDVEELKQSYTKSEAMYQEETLLYNQALTRKEQLINIQNTLLTTQEDWESKQLNYANLNEFVAAMRGNNGVGIERYVLGIMLSSITRCANEYLQNVHQGRYQIYRHDEASGRVRKYGLELMIYDSYTCSMRPVISLSGGEKFLVSLALSLALSTVVQAQNGGIRMEMMFIDEGFGSLDEQSIADALQVLSMMSKNKAMVGIISHVELLKENIPYGIEVEKTKTGSHIHVHV